MEILKIIALLILGLIILIKSADYFVDASVKIAEISGIPKMIIGATIVSLATTLPELFTSLSALRHSADMAVGNALGSVIFNTSVILSIAALFMSGGADRKNIAEKGIVLFTALTTLYIFSLDGKVTWYEALIQLSFVLFYTVINVHSTRKHQKSQQRNFVEVDNKSKVLTLKFIILFVSAVGIFLGSRLLADNAHEIAVMANIPSAVIGLTITAIGTSLPELTTTITSVLKREQSLSVGNVLGANILNVTLVLGSAGVAAKNGLSVDLTKFNFPLIYGVIALFVIPTIFTGKLHKWQGVLGLGAYLGYMSYVIITM